MKLGEKSKAPKEFARNSDKWWVILFPSRPRTNPRNINYKDREDVISLNPYTVVSVIKNRLIHIFM